MGRKPRPLKRYPSFFKVLIDDFSNKLMIPVAFVKHFDGKIPRRCLLWSPAERFWNVNVENFGNALFFDEGWKEFAQENGLVLGDFLVFHYVESSQFHVEIYGRTCCQKSTTAVTASRKRIMFLNYHRENQNKSSEGEQSKEDEVYDQGHSQTRHSRRIPAIRLTPCSKGKVCASEVRAIQGANKYIPEYPFFKCVMSKAYVMKGFLGIPTSFFKMYMNKLERGSTVMLQHKGRSWPVKFCVDERPTARLSAGWSKFVNANAIKLGDVCVFELIQRNDFVLKVIFFRG